MRPPLADNPSIGLDTKKLRQLREDAGLTLAEAAKRAGFSGPQKWSDIERGHRTANITLDTLDRLARALGCSPRDLLTK